MDKKKKRLVTAIIILILLNLLAIASFMYIKNYLIKDYVTDTVYDNRINNPEETAEPPEESEATEPPSPTTVIPTPLPTYDPTATPTVTQDATDIRISNAGDASAGKATPIVFNNMFPGDSIGETYTLSVSYTNTQTSKAVLCFYCKARDNSDLLLLDALELTVVQNGQVVWQGKASEINGVENGLLQKLYKLDDGKAGAFSHRWDITLTASLPTSAGNEYQSLKAILDFYWALGTEGDFSGDGIKDIPVVSPKTGDTLNTALWGIGAAVTLLAIVIVIKRLRKEDESCEE